MKIYKNLRYDNFFMVILFFYVNIKLYLYYFSNYIIFIVENENLINTSIQSDHDSVNEIPQEV